MLLFDSPFMKDRRFTVSVTRQGRRAFNQTSSEALLSIEKVATIMSNTAAAISDFIETLNEVVFGEKEAIFLETLMTKVINAVRATSGLTRVKRKHTMENLQSVLKMVTTRLQEPDLLENLMDEYSTLKFMSTASLKDIAIYIKNKHER
jgi:hypothetical protein